MTQTGINEATGFWVTRQQVFYFTENKSFRK